MRTILKYLLPVLGSAALLCMLNAAKPLTPAQYMRVAAHQNISDYGLFEGMIRNMKPAKGVFRYDVNTALFSDYAYKARFIKLPDGAKIAYDPAQLLELPVGAIIVKHFYYPADFNKPAEKLHFTETRLLIRQPEGWEALTYAWDESQVDATLTNMGSTMPVEWVDAQGYKHGMKYQVPPRAMCKGCHDRQGKMVPVGITARQLNRMGAETPAQNQLVALQKSGIITDMPHISQVPRLPVWDDPTTGDLDTRARAWLDVNCGTCHNPEGTANISAFYLDIQQTDPNMLGLYKRPLFAGRAAADLTYDIVPGRPDSPIL